MRRGIEFFEKEVIQKPQEAAGNVFRARTAEGKKDIGILFTRFEAVTGPSVPAGSVVALKYEVNAEDAGVEDLPLTLHCGLRAPDLTRASPDNITEKVLEGPIRLIPPEPRVSSTNPQTWTNLRCEFKTKTDLEKDLTFNAEGSITFPFSTSRVSLPVYFLDNEFFLSARRQDQSIKLQQFFAKCTNPLCFDIPETLPLRTLYTGEPVEVGMGVNDQLVQPVLVSAQEDFFPRIGITLYNRWRGRVMNVTGLTLRLPSGVSLDREKSPVSTLCPFEESERSEAYTSYVARTDLLKAVEPFGTGQKTNFKTFECWLSIDPSIIDADSSPFTRKDYLADVSYVYDLQSKIIPLTVKAVRTVPILPTSGPEEDEF